MWLSRGASRWWYPLLAVLLCGAGFSGCRQARTPVLTPQMAVQVLATDRQLNDQANNTLDFGLQDRHETGAAAQMDDDSFRRLREAGKSAIPVPFQETEPRAFVSRQYGYPAEFIGEWTDRSSDGSHGSSMGLFVKPTASDPWRVTLFVFASSSSADPLPVLATDHAGYAQRLTTVERAALKPSNEDVAAALATYWNGYQDQGLSVPTALVSGDWTTGRNERLRQDVATKATQHEDEQFAAMVGPYQYPTAYRTRTGDTLVFFSVVERITVSVESPLSFNTPLGFRGEQVLPLSITNGAHAMSLDVLYLLAALIPPGGHSARVIDGYSGPIAAQRIR